MSEFVPKKTAAGNEWDINAAGGSRDVEVEYEYAEGPFGGKGRGYLYLSREDLVAMLDAVEAKG